MTKVTKTKPFGCAKHDVHVVDGPPICPGCEAERRSLERAANTTMHPIMARTMLCDILEVVDECGYVAHRDGALVDWLRHRLTMAAL